MKKKIGVGSISLLLLILSAIWSMDFKDFCLGDIVLSKLGLLAWSNKTTGVHLTVYYSFLFLIPAIALGYKYKNDLFAKSGRTLSTILSCLLFFSIFMIL